MTTLYVSRRRKNERSSSRTVIRHHIGWGVVCILLMAVMAGMWTYSQSLASQNTELRKQLSAQAMPPATCKVSGEWRANTDKKLSLPTPEGQRDFLVHLPADFKNNQYYPLTLFYPGKGGGAQGSGITYGIYSLPGITVFPFPTIGNDGHTAWEGAPYSSGADDVAFTAAILNRLENELCVDKTRIYATGFSNGGAFASLLSCKLPDRFAAYAVIAGAMYMPDGDCQPPRSAPLINIHGDNDVIVPYDGSIVRGLPHIDSWIQKRAAIERCGKPTVTNSDIIKVTTTWSDCRDGGIVQNVRIVGGEHAWGQVSNEALWQFLSRFTL